MGSAPAILALALSAAPAAQAVPPTADQVEFFEKSVRPVLVANCHGCHSATASKIRGGLRVDSLQGLLAGGDSGPAIVPGDPDGSLLVQAVRHLDPDTGMPPKGRLPDAQVAAIERWVAMGAPHPDALEQAGSAPRMTAGIDIERGREFWAYRAPIRAEPPTVRDQAWSTDPVDRFILARLESAGLSPQPDADRRTLARRASLDLTGLPPSPEELERFLADPSPGAYERLVDRLLASPAFGERWGRHWLDVARYAESSGKETNVLYPHAWRYRDYVIDSFNADKPFDEFVREQIAGDLLPARNADERAEHLVATGYLAIGPKGHNTRGKQQFRADMVDEQIDAIGQGLLATTIACARCHDHKFDPIPQRDYYAMAGILMSTETEYGTYQTPGNDHPSGLVELPADADIPNGPVMPGPIRRAVVAQRERASDDVGMLGELREKARAARRPNSGVTLTAQEQAQLVRARSANGREQAADDLLARFGEDGAATAKNRVTMGAKDAARPTDARVLSRGELAQPGEAVPRGMPQVLTDGTQPRIRSGSGRLELAGWIADRGNPLTARVWVNRVWLHLFGAPIVASPDNFGASGAQPTHPELLDWMAVDFMDGGWSTKRLVRSLVLSRTYRMGSGGDPKAMELDPGNALRWHMPSRRLEAEAIRDSMLQAAGTLRIERPEGSPVNYLEGSDRSPLVTAHLSADRPVRSVYLPVLRDRVDEMLDVFDFAEPAFVSGDREETSVPTQALFMMNDERVVAAATAMARRVLREADSEPARIKRAFAIAFGREPSPGEATAARKLLRGFDEDSGGRSGGSGRKGRAQPSEQAWAALCQGLFQSAEFRTVD
jgi:mono/diheme cytochrome c family protein